MILTKNDQVIVYSTDDEERSGANQLAISLIAPVTNFRLTIDIYPSLGPTIYLPLKNVFLIPRIWFLCGRESP